VLDAVHKGGADAVAMADILHYSRATVGDIRRAAMGGGIEVRAYEQG
jgi:cyclase